MSATVVTSQSGATTVLVLMDELTGVGEVRITSGNYASVVKLMGDAPGTPDAEPRNEVIARLEMEATPAPAPALEVEVEARDEDLLAGPEPKQRRSRPRRPLVDDVAPV